MIQQPPPRPFGPVLLFRGARDGRWLLSALIGQHEGLTPTTLRTEVGDHVPAVRIAERDSFVVSRFDFELPHGADAQRHTFETGSRRFATTVPGSQDLHVAFMSCNGHESADLGQPNDLPNRNERWTHVAGLHADEALHLLLHGGDQFYADPVWKVIPALRRRLNRFFVANPSSKFDAATKRQVEHYFFQRYTELYAQPPVAQLLASVPSLMMWDDHDIYDGYGSHPPEWEESALHRGVYEAARHGFRLFQFGLGETETRDGCFSADGSHFGWSYTVGDVSIVAPDLRSTRRFEQVMSEAAWRDFEESLAKLHGCRTLLFISTVPIVNLDVGKLEPIFALLPPSVRFRSDLQDQWQSRAHLAEWQRMLRTLFDFSESRNVRILILSGEIHVAAVGVARRGDATLWQLVSSGIAHPPLGRRTASLLDWLASGVQRHAGGIELAMLPFPGEARRYIGERNWLELRLSSGVPPIARWHFEHRSEPSAHVCD